MNDVYSLLLPLSLSPPHKFAIQSKQPVDQASTAMSTTSTSRPALMVKSLVLLTTHPSHTTHTCAPSWLRDKGGVGNFGGGPPSARARTHTQTHSFSWPFYFRRLPTFSPRVCDGAFSLTHSSACVSCCWTPFVVSLYRGAALGVDLGPAAAFFSRDRLCPFVFFLSLTLTHTQTRRHFAMSRPTVTTTTTKRW